jgi:mannan endo-1,4-beta-mannosidase
MKLVYGLATLALASLAITFLPARRGSPADSAFVTRRGPTLWRHGKPFRFVGVNCYRLLEYADDPEPVFGPLAARGVKVVRFWAFQPLCGTDPGDFSRIGKLLAAARRHDLLLLPVLDNHWSACTLSAGVKPKEWYAAGWRTQPFGEVPLPYADFLRAIGARFQGEPQILAWQLINEPEIEPDTDENFAALRRFAVEAARELKEADPHHLVSLGLLGLGQPATARRKFGALHRPREIDVVSAHDYGYIRDPMPGRDWRDTGNTFYGDLRDAARLGKPFLATESGISLDWVEGNRARRAELFRAKLRAFFAAGGDGYLLWNYEPEPDTDCGFDANDPVLDALAETAAELAL